jgi:hypothetical protein
MSTAEPEVEILWPAALPPDAALAARDELQAAGVMVSCRLQPTRRSPEAIALVLLSAPATAFLQGLFGRFAEDAHQALGRFVHRLLHDGSATPALHSVVFESSTGARVVFTPGLPVEAFRMALTLAPAAGVWSWDPAQHEWLHPETGADAANDR